ncbi:PsbP-related protein [uncultured Kordia sp.]|uniref:PsbP-related protein n=1 Tax=uncultured Kordia sp. TaxID=507699 RepID=UPI00261808C6|nr:PsbP-related protein [uncultured Kordia sp.]
MKKITLLILFVCTSFSIYAQDSWKSITRDAYSIQYPSDWKIDTSGSIGADLIIYSQLSSADDIFTENINVLIQDLTGYNMDLDSYTEISEEQIKTVIQNGKIIESKRVTSGSNPYHRVVYLGEQNGYKLKFAQHYYVIDNKAFVLTLTCEEDQYDNYISTANTVFKSFQLK